LNRTDKIFHRPHVHAGLASYGAIDLRNYRRRNLDAVNAPHVGGRKECTDIADYSTSKSQEKRVTVSAVLKQASSKLFDPAEGFRMLTCRYNHPTAIPDSAFLQQ
jgi:hypothetical protein